MAAFVSDERDDRHAVAIRLGRAAAHNEPTAASTRIRRRSHPSAASAATAAIVTVRSGEEKAGINLQVTPRPLLTRERATFLAPDGPMPNVMVRLITIDPATTMSSPPSQIDEAVSMTAADGQFLFPGVAPGQYRLRVLQVPLRTLRQRPDRQYADHAQRPLGG